MSQAITPNRVCRACGCSDERACPGGCWWVEWDLCSACQVGEVEIEGEVTFAGASCLRCRELVLVLSPSSPPMVFDCPEVGESGAIQGYVYLHLCCDDDEGPGDEWMRDVPENAALDGPEVA